MILVVGGTGHLGAELVPRLSAAGLACRVLTRDVAKARTRLGQGPEIMEGDIRDGAAVRSALQGVDSVISSVTGFGPRGLGVRAIDYDANVQLIRMSEATGATRFVLMSMHGATPDHPMQLMRMKYRAEQSLAASRLKWTVLRPAAFAELWAGIIGEPLAKGGKATLFGRGDNPINFVSVSDLAAVVELTLADGGLGGQVIDVCGPENSTLKQIAEEVGRQLGRAARARHLPVPMLHFARTALGPIRPDLAGLIEAGLSFATGDMRGDPEAVRRRFPQLHLTSMSEVIRKRFGPAFPQGERAVRAGST